MGRDLCRPDGPERVLIGTQIISAVVAATLAAAKFGGHLTELGLIAGALLIGLASTFAVPVQNAMVSALAEQEDAKGGMAMNRFRITPGAPSPRFSTWSSC